MNDTTALPNIVVVGPSGAGKSTLARAIGTRTGLRVIELDALYWDPGWKPASDDVVRERITRATATDGWVADGNYTRFRDLLWANAGTVVWLDLPLRAVLPRIVRRAWTRWRSRELLWGGNRETFWEHFLPNDRSLVWYTVRTHRSRRKSFEVAIASAEWAHLRWVRLRSPREAGRWLDAMPVADPDGGG